MAPPRGSARRGDRRNAPSGAGSGGLAGSGRPARRAATIGSCLQAGTLACRGMLSFAVNTVEKLRRVPRENLINLGLAVLVLIVAVVLIKAASRINRFVLFAIILVLVLVVGLTWIYERNEPKFLTPLIDSLAPFFPQRPRY